MRGLIILIGESFRDGRSGSRERDTDNSFITQKLASERHVLFLNHLKNNLGIDVDLIINTYKTKFEESIIEWYKDFLIEYISNNILIGLEKLLNWVTMKIDKTKYDFVFAIRIDIYLKNMFFEKFDPNWNRITFSQICWTKCCRVDNNEPRVSDVIIFVPKRLFYLFDRYLHLFHESWICYKVNYKLTNSDLNLMIDTYHDSDSFKDWNPLYYIVSREESKIWHSEGYKLNMNTFDGPY
jgi:hypothetical protein